MFGMVRKIRCMNRQIEKQQTSCGGNEENASLVKKIRNVRCGPAGRGSIKLERIGR